MANKSIFKTKKKKQIVVCVYLFSWKPDQAKGKLNKKCYLPVLRTTHANNTQNSDIVAEKNTQTTHTQKLQKYSKQKLQYSELFLSRYLNGI